MSDLKTVCDNARFLMEESVSNLVNELSKIRGGRGDSAILNGVNVDQGGKKVPLAQVANTGMKDAQTLFIQPFEKPVLAQIESAIAGLGLTPYNDGQIIYIALPPMTEARCRELVKTAQGKSEKSMAEIRNICTDTLEKIRNIRQGDIAGNELDSAVTSIQNLADSFIYKCEMCLAQKAKEISAGC